MEGETEIVTTIRKTLTRIFVFQVPKERGPDRIRIAVYYIDGIFSNIIISSTSNSTSSLGRETLARVAIYCPEEFDEFMNIVRKEAAPEMLKQVMEDSK